jgi:hypothetical protein
MTDRTILPAMMLGALMTLAAGDQPAAAQSAPPSAAQPRAACAVDVRTLCADVTPGGGRIMQCMKEKRDQLSEGCKSALIAARDRSKR